MMNIKQYPFFQDGNEGFALYQMGNYKEASPLLKRAIEGGDFRFIITYADICDRDLDDENHPPMDAACLYIKAAETGDGDALSYLRSLSEDLVKDITEENISEKIQKLLSIWACHRNSSCF